MDEIQRRRTVVWLLSVCALIFFMVIVGGITRLTHSGLSMVDWKPLLGAVPPLNEEQWMDKFEMYQDYPEYRQLNQGMTLGEFKKIFFWEYLHRLLGRLIGFAFFVPFVFFYLKKYYDKPMTRKLLFGFVLGGLQGLLGWYMVKSGLVDRPSVSHYRLAAHLSLALFILVYLYWVTLEIWREGREERIEKSPLFKNSFWITGAISLQIVFGAFTAGKKAGFGYNTFPKMGDFWIPETVFFLKPFWINFFENNAGIQFAHRTIAWLLVLFIPTFLWLSKESLDTPRKQKAAKFLLGALGLQFLLGVATIVMYVPVSVAAAHQGGAVILLCSAIYFNHTHYAK